LWAQVRWRFWDLYQSMKQVIKLSTKQNCERNTYPPRQIIRLPYRPTSLVGLLYHTIPAGLVALITLTARLAGLPYPPHQANMPTLPFPPFSRPTYPFLPD
jgi:hypothetical protein